MKPGYKQTEVGVIPEEWGITTLGELKPFITSGSRGWASYYSERGDLFVRITNLSREKIYIDLSDSKFVKIPSESREGTRTQLIEHDILISITADIGIIGYIDASVPSPAYINQHIALIRFDHTKTCGKFVSYFLASEQPQKLFRAATDIGAKAGMSLLTVQKIQTILPPLPEQIAIAEVLSDVDALIASTEALIAKKRAIKQATMQQLLTGQTRLPGFATTTAMQQTEVGLIPADWEVKTFSEILLRLNTKSNQIQTSSYQNFGKHPVIDQGKANVVAFSDNDDLLLKCPQGGLIVFGDHTCIVKYINFDFIVGADGTQILQSKPMQSTHFHALQLQYSGVETTGYNRHFKFLTQRKYATPTLAEQTAIAAVLSDMDAELAVLEAQLHKTRAIKQGMMQELLTGRTRLI
jgi:type I restriction enzyme, S subunit